VATVSAGRKTAPAWRKGIIGELWAEFFGTFIIISFGDGVVAMLWALFGSGRTNAGGGLQSGGDWMLVTWGWALAVTFAVYVTGGISGAHLNPAVTFSAAIRKNIEWSKVPKYWAAQVLGAFVGAGLVFLVYNNAINNYDQVHHIVKGTAASVSTYSTFATFPAPYFHNVSGPLIDQIVGTFFLVLFICAIGDEFNLPVGANLAPFIVGMIVLAVGISFGANAGYAINPARDFGPRMFAWIAGWGKVAFPGDYGHINDYFWIPIVGPLLGGALAAVVYDFGIRDFLIARLGEKPSGVRGGGDSPDDMPFEPEQ
jgi:glycerol uptake facilitator protein